MDGHVRVPSHVEDVAEVVLFADESVAEDVEVTAGELAGADREVSGHVGGEGTNASASVSVSALVVDFRGDGCAYKPSGPPVNVPNLSLVPRSFRSSGSLST